MADSILTNPPFPEAEQTYKIIRYRFRGSSEVIEGGLTLEEAQEHCSREDTRGGSTDDDTAWFDGYTAE